MTVVWGRSRGKGFGHPLINTTPLIPRQSLPPLLLPPPLLPLLFSPSVAILPSTTTTPSHFPPPSQPPPHPSHVSPISPLRLRVRSRLSTVSNYQGTLHPSSSVAARKVWFVHQATEDCNNPRSLDHSKAAHPCPRLRYRVSTTVKVLSFSVLPPRRLSLSGG